MYTHYVPIPRSTKTTTILASFLCSLSLEKGRKEGKRGGPSGGNLLLLQGTEFRSIHPAAEREENPVRNRLKDQKIAMIGSRGRSR